MGRRFYARLTMAVNTIFSKTLLHLAQRPFTTMLGNRSATVVTIEQLRTAREGDIVLIRAVITEIFPQTLETSGWGAKVQIGHQSINVQREMVANIESIIPQWQAGDRVHYLKGSTRRVPRLTDFGTVLMPQYGPSLVVAWDDKPHEADVIEAADCERILPGEEAAA